MTIRPATAADVEAVATLEVIFFEADAWSEASVREELTGERRKAVVACDPDVVGYAVSAVAGDTTDLLRVAVVRPHRRRGLAHTMLTAVLPERGSVLLEVSAANRGALEFYTAEGFQQIDRRPAYYRDGSDAVVMERGGLPA